MFGKITGQGESCNRIFINTVLSIPNLTQALVDNLIIFNSESEIDDDTSSKNESGM